MYTPNTSSSQGQAGTLNQLKDMDLGLSRSPAKISGDGHRAHAHVECRTSPAHEPNISDTGRKGSHQAWHSFASALRAVFCIAICSSLFPLPPGCTGIACFAQTHQSPYKPVVSIRSTARLHLLANSAPPLRRKHCGRQGHLSMPLGTLLPGFLVAFLQYVSRPEAEAGNCVKRLAGSVW